MYSAPSTPSWAKTNRVGSPIVEDPAKIAGYSYPDEYKQSPNSSWREPGWSPRSASYPSGPSMNSEYVPISPIMPSQTHSGARSLRYVSDASHGNRPLSSRQPTNQAEKHVVVQSEGSVLEIPDIPLKPQFGNDDLLSAEIRSAASAEVIFLHSGKGLPYTSIFNMQRPFPDLRCLGFIPGGAIEIAVIDVFKTDFLGRETKSSIYVVQVRNGEQEWILRKTFQDWQILHKHMKELQVRLAGEMGKQLPGYAVRTYQNRSVLPRLPKLRDADLTPAELPGRMQQFTSYLSYLVNNTLCKTHFAVKTFLELSPYSLVFGLGKKLKEGYVLQRISKRPAKPFPVSLICGNSIPDAEWIHVWLVLKETFLMVINPTDSTLKEVLLVDHTFLVDADLQETGIPRGLFVKNSESTLEMQCLTKTQMQEFVMELTIIKHVAAKDYIAPQIFGSLAPPRKTCFVKWLVDGKAYYRAVADAIERAEEEIFICDWWLSSQLHLKRPAASGNEWRLDELLARKAAGGVHIFILLYSENNLTEHLSSAYTKRILKSIDPVHIQAMCHPNQGPGIEQTLWSHNEKLVIVDQSMAFFGGMDLCFGQWDDFHHRLIDSGGKRLRDDSLEFKVSSGNGIIESSLQFIDMLAVLPCLSDANFNRQKSSVRSLKNNDYDQICRPKHVQFKKSDAKNNQTTSLGNGSKIAASEQKSMEDEVKLWIGKDYMNHFIKEVTSLQKFEEDGVNREQHPRLPWHDVGAMVAGPAAADLSRHFIKRWNFSITASSEEKDRCRFLLPKVCHQLRPHDDLICDKTIHTCQVQVLQSLGKWSGGSQDTTDSIHQAFVGLIRESVHYIYIESEMFISLGTGNEQTKNGINDALVQRILKAYRTAKTFRVFVVLPLMPAFEGRMGQSKGSVTQTIMHWTYQSISRGQYSLVAQLCRHMPLQVISDYICFFGLRTFDYINEKPVTEMIYTHSRTVIVDDKVALVGSANINDRSLSGNRDSEIACLITDENFVDSVMDGRPSKSGKFAASLRWRLMMEHMGLMTSTNPKDKELVRDPVCEKFWKDWWLPTARRNTAIYEQVFNCIPSDEIRDFMELEFWERRPKLVDVNVDMAKRALEDIQGNLVIFPLGFLRNETLRTAILTSEGLMAANLWT